MRWTAHGLLFDVSSRASLGHFGGAVDGFSDTKICPATTNVAGHRFVDIFIGGLGLLAQQHGGAHELTRLAVATLGNIFLKPRELQGVTEIRRKALDCRHFFSRRSRYRSDAGTHSLAIN